MNMTGYAVHLIAIAVHPSGAPDVLYMIVSTAHLMQYNQVRLLMYMMAYVVHLCGKYSILSEAPDLRDRICSTLDGKCSISKCCS